MAPLPARGLAALVLALAAALPGAGAARGQASLRINPMRRVISMLQLMQKKVTEEGKKEEALFEKYQCFCKTGSGDLTGTITAAEAKIPEVESGLGGARSQKKQLEAALAAHKADRADAKGAVAEATAVREREAAAFAKESSDDKTNIAALGKAIAALEKGSYGSFLQSASAMTLRRLAVDAEMGSFDREVLASFLSQGQSAGYVPRATQIVGILKQMKDTMAKSLAVITAEEEQSIKDYDGLVAAKEKEIRANTAAIEAKLQRHGEVGTQIVSLEADLDDTTKSLAEDKKFLAELETGCKTKQSEWDARSQMRSEELAALAEAVGVLSDDDALELFKKTLPSPALLQTKVTAAEVRRRALAALARGARGSRGLEPLALALRAGAGGGSFGKVVKMIDDMVALLGKEQAADDEKKAYCEAELDKAEDEKKSLDLKASDLGKALDEANGIVAKLTEEINGLEDDIKELDKQVMEATEMRKEEHSQYTETMAADGAAKRLIAIAVNKLAKFYTPKLYKAPPKRELTESERITENMGVTLPPTAAPGGIANTGVTYLQGAPVLAQVAAHRAQGAAGVAPAPPPETWDAYAKKTEEHGGVVALLNMLTADLDKEIQSMTVDEKDAQAEYEKLMADSAAKRTAESKSIADKEATKADLEADIQKMSAEKKATTMEVMAKAEFIHSLHLECDWLAANFEARKEARAGEVSSLTDAKAVLSGADYSLLQAAEGRQRLRGSL